MAKIDNDNGLCRRMQISAICLCFRFIYQSLVWSALEGCDSVLVQIKFPEIERNGESRDGVFGDGRRRKEVLLPQQKATTPVMDGS